MPHLSSYFGVRPFAKRYFSGRYFNTPIFYNILAGGTVSQKDFDFLVSLIMTSNLLGNINKDFTSIFNFTKNLINISDKNYILNANLVKNNVGLINNGFSLGSSIVDNLSAQINNEFLINVNNSSSKIGLQNQIFTLTIGLIYDILSNRIILKDFDFVLTLSLIKTLLASVNKDFVINDNLSNRVLGLENFTFNDIIYVPSTKIGIENNNFTVTWPYAGTNLAQTSKTLGIDSRYLTNLNMTTDKTYSINYTLLKSLLVQKNPDFGVAFNSFLQTNSLTKQDLPISIPLSHDEVKNLLKNYSFPLILDLDYDIATQAGSIVILDILGVDDNFWCIIKEIKNWVSTKDIQIYIYK